MRLEKINLKRTCSFYISEFHLSTLLLPYITERVRRNVQIETFIENSIEENIKKVIRGINIEEYIKKEIMKIDWNDFELTKYSKIVDRIKVEDRDINIIVSGSKEYIENINIGINRLIENLNAKGLRDKINVTINNCYPVREVLSVKEILDKHDLLLNTSGEVEIDSVFQDYRKVSNI